MPVPKWVGIVVYAAASAITGAAASGLLAKKKQRPALLDEKQSTTASLGVYVPVMVGRRRLGPRQLWWGNRTVIVEGQAGGKGTSGGGTSQTVYREDAFHGFVTGPARAVHQVKENGNVVWDSSDEGDIYKDGITPETHPSGSSFVARDGSVFRVYFGEPDQSANDLLADPRFVGVRSRWPFLAYIHHVQKRLGGFARWGDVQVEWTVRPYREGQGVALPYASAPPRLANSPDWFQNGFGPAGFDYPIVGVNNAAPGASPPPYIKFWAGPATGTDETAEFLASLRCRVDGQPGGATGKYAVADATYDVGETIFVPRVPPVWSEFGLPNDNVLTAWTENAHADVSVSLVPKPTGPVTGGNTTYNLKIQTLSLGTPRISLSSPGHVNSDFSPNDQRIRIWLHQFGDNVDAPQWVRIGWRAYNHASLPDNEHSVLFERVGGVVTSTPENGALGSVAAGPGADGWDVFEVTYRSGNGPTPSGPDWEREAFVEYENTNGPSFPTGVALVAWTTENPLSEDDGLVRTGICTVELAQALSGAVQGEGTIDPLVEGTGADGANAAHILHQYLFATYPHGRGLSTDIYDLDSLEAVGEGLAPDTGAGLRVHSILDDGKQYREGIEELMVNCGIYWSWSMDKGKWVFGLVRDADDPGSLPRIPLALLEAPKPEHAQNQPPLKPDKQYYSFANRDVSYREDAVYVGNDGFATLVNNYSSTNKQLEVITDDDAAALVARYREQEEDGEQTTWDLTCSRGASRLIPGTKFVVEGIEDSLGTPQVLLLSEVEYRKGSDVVTLRAVSMPGLQEVSYPVALLANRPPPPVDYSPAEDLVVAPFEVPLLLSPRQAAILVPRIRSRGSVVGAALHLSRDGLSYRMLENRSDLACGGTLTGPWGAGGPRVVENGPTIKETGQDIVSLVEALDETSWRTGRQWALFPTTGEVCFLREVRSVGEGLWQLHGLLRGRYGTDRGALAEGDQVVILRSDLVSPVSSALLAPGVDLRVKYQPRTDRSVVPLSEVTAQTLILEGKALQPGRVLGLRTSTMIPGYRSGESVSLRWNYVHPDGARERTAAGYQTAGEDIRAHQTIPFRFFLTIKDGSTVVREASIASPSYTYDNADIVSDLGGEKDFTVEVGVGWNGQLVQSQVLNVSLY